MEAIKNKWTQHFILLSAPLLTVIDAFIVNIAIPSIKKGIGATDGQMELVIVAYLSGYASFMITGGRAGDHWGRKKAFMWGMLFFIITSCICGLAQSPALLIAARFFQGVSGAFMTPQALSYVQILFPDTKERTRAIGYVGITLGIASILGQFLGGYFSGLDTFIAGWRFIFFINLPVGLIALWATRKYLKETRINSEHKFDYAGIFLLTLTLGCFIFPLTEGRELGWPAWSIILLLCSFILFYLFILHQKRKLAQQSGPLINMHLFGIRNFNTGLLLAAFYFMMHTSYMLMSTIYLQEGLKIGPFQTGLYFVCFGVCFMLSSFLSIKLSHAYGKRPVQGGVLLMILSYFLQLKFFTNEAQGIVIFSLLSLSGFAAGFILPSLINISLKKIPQNFVGAASGVYNTVQQAAASVGICIIGGVFFYMLSKHAGIAIAFRYGIYGDIICLIIVFLLLVTLKDKPDATVICVADTPHLKTSKNETSSYNRLRRHYPVGE